MNKEELSSNGELNLHVISELAIDVITFIDVIKDKYQYILKMDSSKLHIEVKVISPSPQHIKIMTGSILLAKTSKDGYKRLRKEIASDFSTEKARIPTLCMMK